MEVDEVNGILDVFALTWNMIEGVISFNDIHWTFAC